MGTSSSVSAGRAVAMWKYVRRKETKTRDWIEENSLCPLEPDTLIPLSVEESKLSSRETNERTNFGKGTTTR